MTLAGWLILVIPLVFDVVILLFLFKRLVIDRNLSTKNAKQALILIIAMFFGQLIAYLIFAYCQIKQSTLGVYLLKDYGYLGRSALMIAYPYGEGLVAALIFVLFGYLAFRYYQRPIIEKIDLYIIFICILVTGYPNILVLIGGTLILMVLFQLVQMIIFRKYERMALSPYLLFFAIVILILNNFNFYHNFLNLIGLV